MSVGLADRRRSCVPVLSRCVTITSIVIGMMAWGLTDASELVPPVASASRPRPPAATAHVVDHGPPVASIASRRGPCGDAPCTHEHCGGDGHSACRREGCEVEGCPAHCPVRPASFGFYGTQWRSWPGQQVAQAAHAEPAAPVMPPKSEVPTAAEESPVPGFEEPAAETAAAETQPTDADAAGKAPAILPPPDAAPDRRNGELQDEEPKTGEPKTPGKKPADDNLFDEAALQRRSGLGFAMIQQAALHKERIRRENLQQAARFKRPPVAHASPVGEPPVAPTAVEGERTEITAEQSVSQATHAAPDRRGLRSAVRAAGAGSNPLR